MADVAFTSDDDDDDDDEPLSRLLFRFGLEEPIVFCFALLLVRAAVDACLLPPLPTVGFDSKLLLLLLLLLLYLFIGWLIDYFDAWMGGSIDFLLALTDGFRSVRSTTKVSKPGKIQIEPESISKRVHNNNNSVCDFIHVRAVLVQKTITISKNSKIILAARRGFQRRPKKLFS